MILFTIGSVLIFISSLGLVFEKDVLGRASAASIGTGLGVICIGFGSLSFDSVHGQEWKVLVSLFVLLLSGPIVWQALGRGVLREKELAPNTHFHVDSSKKESLTDPDKS